MLQVTNPKTILPLPRWILDQLKKAINQCSILYFCPLVFVDISLLCHSWSLLIISLDWESKMTFENQMQGTNKNLQCDNQINIRNQIQQYPNTKNIIKLFKYKKYTMFIQHSNTSKYNIFVIKQQKIQLIDDCQLVNISCASLSLHLVQARLVSQCLIKSSSS